MTILVSLSGILWEKVFICTQILKNKQWNSAEITNAQWMTKAE